MEILACITVLVLKIILDPTRQSIRLLTIEKFYPDECLTPVSLVAEPI